MKSKYLVKILILSLICSALCMIAVKVVNHYDIETHRQLDITYEDELVRARVYTEGVIQPNEQIIIHTVFEYLGDKSSLLQSSSEIIKLDIVNKDGSAASGYDKLYNLLLGQYDLTKSKVIRSKLEFHPLPAGTYYVTFFTGNLVFDKDLYDGYTYPGFVDTLNDKQRYYHLLYDKIIIEPIKIVITE